MIASHAAADGHIWASPPPSLEADYGLTQDQVRRYRDHGHLCLRQVATEDEISYFRPIILETVERENKETRSIEERDTYGKAFLQIENLWAREARLKGFTLARRFAKIAADLMEVRGVRIYHDQALFKEPGGGQTPFHQDQFYWPLDTSNTITMWMPLVEVPAQLGSMTFASGSHKCGHLGNFAISDESEAVLQRAIAERSLERVTYGAMRPGDTTWHAGWTLHGAPANSTGILREVMTIIYMDMDAKVIEPGSDERRSDLRNWLNGIAPGQPAAGPLNPVVYCRDHMVV